MICYACSCLLMLLELLKVSGSHGGLLHHVTASTWFWTWLTFTTTSKLDAFVSHSKPPPIPLATSQEVRDRGSTFSGYIYRATSVDSASSIIKYVKHVEHASKPATHEIAAWRCMVLKKGKTGLTGDDDFELVQGSKDDGERWAGERILRVMQSLGAIDAVVVVSRWYGGNMLGPARFTHVETCAHEACQLFIQQEKLQESLATLSSLDDILADLRQQLAELSPTPTTESGSSQKTRKKMDYAAQEDMDLPKAKRLITARENSIKSVKAIIAKKYKQLGSTPDSSQTESAASDRLSSSQSQAAK